MVLSPFESPPPRVRAGVPRGLCHRAPLGAAGAWIKRLPRHRPDRHRPRREWNARSGIDELAVLEEHHTNLRQHRNEAPATRSPQKPHGTTAAPNRTRWRAITASAATIPAVTAIASCRALGAKSLVAWRCTAETKSTSA